MQNGWHDNSNTRDRRHDNRAYLQPIKVSLDARSQSTS
jgi:hypothetical protein